MSRKESDEVGGGFQPIDPWKTDGLVIRRRNLPHLEVPGATYFLTLRCRANVTLSSDARDIIIAAIRACDGESIELDATVVMPDHAHLIFRLIGGTKLSRIVQRIKGASARRINQVVNADGPLWMDESFDHIIRHEAELEEKVDYVKSNPVKKGLVDLPEDYRWLFVRAGITG